MEWKILLGSTPWEIVATISSLVGVFLLARQSSWGWPLGMLWATISAWLAYFEWSLLSDAILYASYIPIQAYCWWNWTRRRHSKVEAKAHLRPHWLSLRRRILLAVLLVLVILCWGSGMKWLCAHIAWIPSPALLWRDASSTVLNYFAQFLQAQKWMENWVLWVLTNCLGIHIYWIKGVPIYSVQYAIFLILGIYGWVEWQRSLHRQGKETTRIETL